MSVNIMDTSEADLVLPPQLRGGGGGEEIHAPMHIPFRGSVEGADVGEKKFMGGGCGNARLEVRPSGSTPTSLQLGTNVHTTALTEMRGQLAASQATALGPP
nr:unnamed protein product [Spirometra erinaceieuropaei]